MVQSQATTVKQYLEALPPGRRDVVSAVRRSIRRHLPPGYRESMGWGMITYSVPLTRYPDTYNGRPLCYVALAAQKHYYALYLMGVYQDPGQRRRLEAAFRARGLRIDLGKSCLRFRSLEDIPLDEVGALVASTPVDAFVAAARAAHAAPDRARTAKKR